MHANLVQNNYPVPADADTALAALDTDASGTVSFNEFVAYMSGLNGFD
jgi:hypothetical protein